MRCCDRCGKEIWNFPQTQTMTPMVFITVFDFVAGFPNNTKIDLCVNCQKDFLEKFLIGEPDNDGYSEIKKTGEDVQCQLKEGAAMTDKKQRKTNKGDFCEANFHGECMMRCRLCGKVYEAQTEYIDEETGEHYCPWCYGYGRIDNG